MFAAAAARVTTPSGHCSWTQALVGTAESPRNRVPHAPQEPGSLALAQAEILVPLLVQDVFGAASLCLCAPALVGVHVGQTDGSE